MVLVLLGGINLANLKGITIGFDFDDVLTNTVVYEYEMLKKWLVEEEKIGNFIIRWNQDANTLEGRYPGLTSVQLKRFNLWYFPKMVKECPFSEYVKELFDALHELGAKVYIVTRRNEYEEKYEYTGPMMRQDTENRLRESKISYDRIFFSCFNKLDVMEKNHIDMLVDDSLINIFQVSQKKPIIVMDRPWNKHIVGERIYHVSSLNPKIFIPLIHNILVENSANKDESKTLRSLLSPETASDAMYFDDVELLVPNDEMKGEE